MKGKGFYKCSVLSVALLVCLLLLTSSCAFLHGVLDDLLGGRSYQEYTLIIHYDYYGDYFNPGYSRIIIWVMPLDEKGDVIKDPNDPEGPPLRKELHADDPYGMISADLESREYALLAFHDENGDGQLNLYEFYTIYEGESFASGVMDRIELSSNITVTVRFDDSQEFHAVVIRFPSEGEPINGNFIAKGGFITDAVDRIEVYINTAYQGDAIISHDYNYWEFPVNISPLAVGSYHSLGAKAYDQDGYEIDQYWVNFYLQSK